MEFVLSLLAGLVSFFSPCILPLFPVYLSTINTKGFESKQHALVNTLIFVFSFCTMFILLALSATSIGFFLNINKIFLTKLAGILIITFGIINLEIFKIDFLLKNYRLQFSSSNRYLKPILFGLSFGIAWTPCIGPILASIIAYSSVEKNYEYSFLILSAYSILSSNSLIAWFPGIWLPSSSLKFADAKVCIPISTLTEFTYDY